MNVITVSCLQVIIPQHIPSRFSPSTVMLPEPGGGDADVLLRDERQQSLILIYVLIHTNYKREAAKASVIRPLIIPLLFNGNFFDVLENIK